MCSSFNLFRRSNQLYGFIGAYNIDMQLKNQTNRIQIKDVIDKIFLHPQWNQTTRNADIALIRLKTDVPYTSK